MKLSPALLYSIYFCAGIAGAYKCKGTYPSQVPDKLKTHMVTLSSGRQFGVHLPPNYDARTKKPVYFSFHGGGKDATQQETLSSLSNSTFNPNGIAIYPQGNVKDSDEPQKHYWLSNPGLKQTSPNDLDFAVDMIQWVESNLCNDPARIYATGKSNGGGFVDLLACNATTSAYFAAVATVSGAYYQNDREKACAPSKIIPFLSFHGLNDTTIPYQGKVGDDGIAANSDDTYPIDDWLKLWLKRNKISASTKPTINTLYDKKLVTQYLWNNTAGVPIVVHYKENDLGHVWPSKFANPDCEMPQNDPKQPGYCPMGNYTFNATTVVLDFFSGWISDRK